MSDLPEMLKIGAFDIHIKPLDHEAEASELGYFSKLNQTIGLSNNFSSKRLAAVTLLHEIFHAIYWAQDIKSRDGEERTVEMMSSGFAQVWRDNPKLIEYLDGALK